MSQPELHDQSALQNRRPSGEHSIQQEDGNCSIDTDEAMDYATLQRELMQLRELDEDRVARIYHLEQALDQALLCIQELRVKVRDQGILESQLAMTEEFASIQQKAIARLQMQLQQQQRVLESATLQDDVNEYHGLLQEVVGVMKAIAAQQDQIIAQLQECQVNSQADAVTHAQRLDRETSKLQAALDQRERQILSLEAELLTSHAQLVRLQMELDAASYRVRSLRHDTKAVASPPEEGRCRPEPNTLPDTQAFIAELLPLSASQSAPQEFEPFSPQQTIAKLQAQIEELELQLSRQTGTQARWQQRCLELETDLQRYQTRTHETQQQIAEMQEEILRQTKQAGEYEAAIQHWKDRYLHNQRSLGQLQELLERVLPLSLSDPDSGVELNPALSELLMAIQSALMPEHDDDLSPTASPTPRFNTLDIPDFLIRRRSYYRQRIPPSSSEPE